MTDYTKLIKELRETAKHLDGISRFPYDDDPAKRIYSKKIADTADAIEALVSLLDQNTQRCEALREQLRDAHESYEKHLNELEAQLPKLGEWLIHSTGGSMATKKCPFCGSESWQSKEYAKVPKYCQNCGAHLPTFNIVDWVDYLYAKMEVQDADK